MIIPENSDFSIHNLPFGIFSTEGGSPRAGIAVGDRILDLTVVAEMNLFHFDTSVFYEDTLNAFIGLGKEITSGARTQVQAWLKDDGGPLSRQQDAFVPMSAATMHMPVRVGDYTDFYSSIEHATNVGKLFRDPENALLPNWRHLPVGYHGRASSIIVSGVDIRRPKGQVKPNDADSPRFQPSGRLDFELEMGFVIGKDSELGSSIPTGQATDYIFGMLLFNDWSARDIQKWEYVPLGPFLGKSFASSVSPWIVTMDALAPFRVDGPTQDPEVLDYLKYEGRHNYDIALEVTLTPDGGTEEVISESNYKYMYWNMAQQLAHHTINGCNVRIGDVMASGTISGKDESAYGSLLEISHGGRQPLTLKDGSQRTFIEDGDRVTLRGYAKKDGIRVGFGEVTAKVLPAN